MFKFLIHLFIINLITQQSVLGLSEFLLPSSIEAVLSLFGKFQEFREVFSYLTGNQKDATKGFLDEVNQHHPENDIFTQETMERIMEKAVADRFAFENSRHVFEQNINRIDIHYENLQRYFDPREKFSQNQLIEAARSMVHLTKSPIRNSLNKLNGGAEKYFQLLYKSLQRNQAEFCDIFHSPQQVMWNDLNKFALAQAKSYHILLFSNNFLNSKINSELKSSKHVPVKRSTETPTMSPTVLKILNSVNKMIKTLSREMWRCDPVNHIEGNTYTQIQLYQDFMANQFQFDDKSPSYMPDNVCPFRELSKENQHLCPGKVMQCSRIPDSIKYCPSDPKKDRLYEYIDWKNGTTFGDKTKCRYGQVETETKYRVSGNWFMKLHEPARHCMCTCEKNLKVGQHVSLVPSFADFSKNKVVTGARLRNIGGVIYIQIQQGTLSGKGTIKETNIAWRAVQKVENVRALHTITDSNNGVFLDDIDAPEGEVLVGLGFSVDNKNRRENNFFKLIIYTMRFDEKSGKLLSKQTLKDRYNKNNLRNRDEIDLLGNKLPIKAHSSRLVSKSNSYLRFQKSDVRSDIGQSTVPFIDLQSIEYKEKTSRAALSGAGLFYKSSANYGGFLSLKLFTYRVAENSK